MLGFFLFVKNLFKFDWEFPRFKRYKLYLVRMSERALNSLLDELGDLDDDYSMGAPSTSTVSSSSYATQRAAAPAAAASASTSTSSSAYSSRAGSSDWSSGLYGGSSNGSTGGGSSRSYGGSSSSSNSSYGRSSAGAAPSRKPTTRRGGSALDDLLDECDDVMGSASSSSSAPSYTSYSASAAAPAATKQSGGASSGSNTGVILSGGVDGVAQDDLFCLKCDMEVLCFPGSRWNASADYLFFRNFHPDQRKLGERLVRDGGTTAFSCQCTWQSIGGLRPKAVRSGLGGTAAAPEGGTAHNGDVRWCRKRRR